MEVQKQLQRSNSSWLSEDYTMSRAVLHESGDTVGVAVVEGIKAGTKLNAWTMEDDTRLFESA
jgi:(2R)-sulfolactate sulfo-lyase subunit alpha